MNKELLRQYKAEQKMVKHNIEVIYSAMCVVLHRQGYTEEQLIDTINQVQELWFEVANNPDTNMVKVCEEETGINILEMKC